MAGSPLDQTFVAGIYGVVIVLILSEFGKTITSKILINISCKLMHIFSKRARHGLHWSPVGLIFAKVFKGKDDRFLGKPLSSTSRSVRCSLSIFILPVLNMCGIAITQFPPWITGYYFLNIWHNSKKLLRQQSPYFSLQTKAYYLLKLWHIQQLSNCSGSSHSDDSMASVDERTSESFRISLRPRVWYHHHSGILAIRPYSKNPCPWKIQVISHMAWIA